MRPAILRDGEVVVDEFVGPFSRLTLTKSRIILTRFLGRERTIAYEDVSYVDGGWFACEEAVYGVYFKGDGFEETARVPRAKHAAALIEARMTPPRPIGPDELYEGDRPPRWS